MLKLVKIILLKIRSIGTYWIANQTLTHLEEIRLSEFKTILKLLPKKGNLLEIGAGTGWQAHEFEQNGYQVEEIDLPTSNYSGNRIRPVIDYDGKHIPFKDNAFDIIFTSNVLNIYLM